MSDGAALPIADGIDLRFRRLRPANHRDYAIIGTEATALRRS
jgi:hypothetical protein